MKRTKTKKLCVLLALWMTILSVMPSNAETTSGDDVYENVPRQTASLAEPDEILSEDFSLGSNGYYIINGAGMVSGQMRSGERVTFYALEDGIHVQEGEKDEYLLCNDMAANLNFGEGNLFYNVTVNRTDYIKMIDMDKKQLVKSFELRGFHIRHMYLVSGRYLLFSSGGKIYSLNIETEALERFGDYEGVFSFIPTAQGILYAQGQLFDYTLYAGKNLLEEHVSDYYMEGDVLVYRKDGEECRADADRLFAADFQNIAEAYTEQTSFQTISEEEFLEDLRDVVPQEEEEENVLFDSAVIPNTFPGDEPVVLDAGEYGIRDEVISYDAGASIPAVMTDEQRAIKERAEEIYNDVWKTLGEVRKWGEEDQFIPKGTEIHGIIYCQPVYRGKFVLAPNGNKMTMEDYRKEREDVESLLYSDIKDDWAYNKFPQDDGPVITKYGPKYGTDCSTFASYCWGLGTRETTVSITDYGNNVNEKYGVFYGLQVGDIINWSEVHVIVITGIAYNQNGSITEIQTIEQTNICTTRNILHSYSEFAEKYKKKKKDGYILYRSNKLTDAETPKITLSDNSKKIDLGESFRLKATVIPGGKVHWSSGNTGIATVDSDGNVRAVGEGSTKITATVYFENDEEEYPQPYAQAFCEITVNGYSVSLNKKEVTIYVGKYQILTATRIPKNDAVTWTSSNYAVAHVDQSGKVTGKNPGKATITAKTAHTLATCEVTVQSPTLTISDREKTVYIGYPYRLKVTTEPDKKVTWTSSNSNVATVSDSGYVEGKKKGKVTITATANGLSASCKVTVSPPTLTLNASSLKVYAGKSIDMVATPVPETSIKWTSSNTAIAKVNASGKVTGVKAGTAKITATGKNVSKTCTVTVINPKIDMNTNKTTLYTGHTLALKATPTPAATVTWRSSDKGIATVDGQGNVIGKSKGTVTITATANGVSKSRKIVVKQSVLEFDKDDVTVYIGDSTKLKIKNTPKATVVWNNTNSAVASVDSKGNVKGLSLGTTFVRISAHGISKTCTVRTRKKEVFIANPTITLTVGKKQQIKVSTAPSKKPTYKSENPSIATVDSKGVVKAKKPGETRIKVTANGITAYAKVKVYK